MSKDAPGYIDTLDAQKVQRLWDSETRGVNQIAETTGLTRYEVLFILMETDRLTLDACYNFDPVKEVKDVQIVHLWEDDHLPCMSIFFKDEKDRLRYAEILWDEYGPGMAKYASCCREAYNDLIKAINNYYQMRKEEEEENV